MDSGRGIAHLEGYNMIGSPLAQLEDDVPWYNKPNLRLLYLLMLPACIGVEMTSGYDMSMTNALQAVPSWIEYYHHPHSATLGLIGSMYSLGGFAAAPFVSSVVDRTGRRFPILLGGMIAIFASILQGSALNLTMFVAARFLLGFSNIFCVVAASSLIGELSHPKERAALGCLFNTSFDLGATGAASVAFTTFAMTSNWGWRIPSFLQVVPSLLQVSFIWFIPESPRWLVSKGRGQEARAILVTYHAEGDKNSHFVEAEYNQIEQTLEAEMRAARTNRNVMLSTPGMRKRVLIASFLGFFTQWSGTGLISAYLVVILDGIGIHDHRTKNFINMAKYSWSFVNGVFISFIVPRYPRRRIFLMCTISILLVFIAWTVANAEYSFTQSKVAAEIALTLIFFYSPAYNLAFTALTYPYLVELFPFQVRAKGGALYQWWTRCAAFTCQFANPIGLDAAGWKWYIVYCVWNTFQVVFVYFVFPETSGRTLEELTFLFESDRELLGHAESEVLITHEGNETYGTIGDGPRTGCNARA